LFQQWDETLPLGQGITITGLSKGNAMFAAFVSYVASIHAVASVGDLTLAKGESKRQFFVASSKLSTWIAVLTHWCHWLFDLCSIASALHLLLRAFMASSLVLFSLLIVNLWVPGFVYVCWGHCLFMKRKFVGPGVLTVPPFCGVMWCCGCVWAFFPVGFILAAFVIAMYHAIYTFVFAAARHFAPAAATSMCPISVHKWCIYELYMLHVRICGDLPRLVICIVFYMLPDGGDISRSLLMCIVISSICLLQVLSPGRRATVRGSFYYFNEIAMEQESD